MQHILIQYLLKKQHAYVDRNDEQHASMRTTYWNMSSSSMTIYIGFPSKVAGVTIVGEYPLGFNRVGTGNVWTPESTAAFHEMKLTISKYTTMHSMSDKAQIA